VSLLFSCKFITATPVKTLLINHMKKKEIDMSCKGFDKNIPATAKTIDPRITIPRQSYLEQVNGKNTLTKHQPRR